MCAARQLGDDAPGRKKDAAAQAGAAANDNEIFLAELAFSNPMELPKIVERNLNKLDDKFYICARPRPAARSRAGPQRPRSTLTPPARTVLDSKIKATTDADEKETLELLREAVTGVPPPARAPPPAPPPQTALRGRSAPRACLSYRGVCVCVWRLRAHGAQTSCRRS
jgi:hypothetical protein